MFTFASRGEYAAFRKTLTAERTKQGLTQREVAERLPSGITQSTVSKIERGERRLDVVEFIVFVRAIGAGPREIIAKIEQAFPR